MAIGIPDKSGGGPPSPGRPPQPAAKPSAPGVERSGFSGLRVSLMPSETDGGKGPDLRRGLLILAFVLVIEMIAIGGVDFWLAQDTAKRQAERAGLDSRIVADKKMIEDQGKLLAAAIDLDRQVRAVKEGLTQHVYWTQFFDFLEANSRPNIHFLRFSGEAESGIFSVDVLGRSYRDIAEQIVGLKENPDVASVRATSASARTNQNGEIDGVSTTMMVKVKPGVWIKSPDKAAP